jgi:hypothetical protein
VTLNKVPAEFVKESIKKDWWREEIDKENRLVATMKSVILKFPAGTLKSGVNTLEILPRPEESAKIVRAEIKVNP